MRGFPSGAAVVSYFFDHGDDTVWSPALRVGDLYLALARELARCLDVPLGLRANASDHYCIDLDEFERFVRSLYDRYFSSRHAIQRSLIDGVLVVSLAMLHRCGVVIPPRTEDQASLQSRVSDTLCAMPA